jgi:hypothetical protein
MSTSHEILIFSANNDREMAHDPVTNRLGEGAYKMPEISSVDALFGSQKGREFCRNKK